MIVDAYIGQGGSAFVPGAFSYANSGGSGDRTAGAGTPGGITITATVSLSAGSFPVLINGSSTDLSTSFASSASNPNGVYIKFEFDKKKSIDQFTWKHGSNVAQGTWDLQGSLDDGATDPYHMIKTSWGINDAGSSANVVDVDVGGDAVIFKYLKMTKIGGTTSTTPREQEVTFRIRDMEQKMADETISMRRVTKPYELLVRLCNPRDASEHVGIQYTIGTWNVIGDEWQFAGEKILPIDKADKVLLNKIISQQYTDLLDSHSKLQKQCDALIEKHESVDGTEQKLEQALKENAHLQEQVKSLIGQLNAALAFIDDVTKAQAPGQAVAASVPETTPATPAEPASSGETAVKVPDPAPSKKASRRASQRSFEQKWNYWRSQRRKRNGCRLQAGQLGWLIYSINSRLLAPGVSTVTSAIKSPLKSASKPWLVKRTSQPFVNGFDPIQVNPCNTILSPIA